MSGKKIFVVLAVGAFLSPLGAVSAAANDVDRTGDRGGYVVPPSTSGVNPVHHHEYFGKPANYACFDRFKTYEAASGTYLGYDGRRHLCKG
jgi:BA14K-like protein